MKLMTTKAGKDGMETHINNVFLLAVVFIIAIGLEISDIWPPDKEVIQEQIYTEVTCV